MSSFGDTLAAKILAVEELWRSRVRASIAGAGASGIRGSISKGWARFRSQAVKVWVLPIGPMGPSLRQQLMQRLQGGARTQARRLQVTAISA
ncbi:hypothetical protein QJQ45_024265 [Haematococcus lacustris]|nr:hypothetical protein QJQ45_024265 [Haematococcus lacustris]